MCEFAVVLKKHRKLSILAPSTTTAMTYLQSLLSFNIYKKKADCTLRTATATYVLLLQAKNVRKQELNHWNSSKKWLMCHLLEQKWLPWADLGTKWHACHLACGQRTRVLLAVQFTWSYSDRQTDRQSSKQTKQEKERQRLNSDTWGRSIWQCSQKL